MNVTTIRVKSPAGGSHVIERSLAGIVAVLLIASPLRPPSAAAQWDGNMLKQVYGDAVLYIEGVANLKAGTRTEPWQGTGFVVDARGWLLTNSHVYLPPSLTDDLVKSVELTARAGPGGNPYKL